MKLFSNSVTLTRASDKSALNKDNAVNIGEIKNNVFEWYIPHYTPSIAQQYIISKQTLSKTPTELQYVERINIQNYWTFGIGTQEGINVPMWIIVGFQQRDSQDAQLLNNDNFYRPSVTSAQGSIGIEKYPPSGILISYDDDKYSQGYGQIKEAFGALTNDDILQP